MRVHEAVHQIQFALQTLPANRRLMTLHFARMSYDENTGELLQMSEYQEKKIRCIDCPENVSGGECRPDCPNRVVIE